MSKESREAYIKKLETKLREWSVSLCRAHFLKLSEFSPDLIRDGLKAAQKFLKSIYSQDARRRQSGSSSHPDADHPCRLLIPCKAY